MAVATKSIREQMRLCDRAVAALRRYHEARGVLPEEQTEDLRRKAEVLFAAVQTYIADARCDDDLQLQRDGEDSGLGNDES